MIPLSKDNDNLKKNLEEAEEEIDTLHDQINSEEWGSLSRTVSLKPAGRGRNNSFCVTVERPQKETLCIGLSLVGKGDKKTICRFIEPNSQKSDELVEVPEGAVLQILESNQFYLSEAAQERYGFFEDIPPYYISHEESTSL